MSNLDVRKIPFSQKLNSEPFQIAINNAINDPKRKNMFVTSIVSAVSSNPALAACDSKSILTAALLGEGLQLTPSPQLGYFYMVPFQPKKYNPATKQREPDGLPIAQFILGYKGYIQLAIRSGQYKRINVIEIKEGEYKSYDYLTNELEYFFISDYEGREKAATIGYYATFETINGFIQSLYWSKEQMLAHADKYSPAFNKADYAKLLNGEIQKKDEWKFSSFWYKDFDVMAKKTMLRQLISKWGIMSVEMQTAFESDIEPPETTDIPASAFDIEEPPLIEDTAEEVNLNDI